MSNGSVRLARPGGVPHEDAASGGTGSRSASSGGPEPAPRIAAAALSATRGAIRGAMLGAIRAYQLLLSPWLGRDCRYWPTCSHYAAEAIERFGPARGAWLAARRLGGCHPWGGSGYDPVPEPADAQRDAP